LLSPKAPTNPYGIKPLQGLILADGSQADKVDTVYIDKEYISPINAVSIKSIAFYSNGERVFTPQGMANLTVEVTIVNNRKSDVYTNVIFSVNGISTILANDIFIVDGGKVTINLPLHDLTHSTHDKIRVSLSD